MESMTIVTRAELQREPAGSPARAILRLWRSVQFRDPDDALAQCHPRPTPKELTAFEDFIVGAGGDAACTSKPRILG